MLNNAWISCIYLNQWSFYEEMQTKPYIHDLSYRSLHLQALFICFCFSSPLMTYSQLGASHIPFSSTSRPPSSPIRFTSPITSQLGRTESPPKREVGFPKSQSAESYSSSSRSAGRRKLPVTPHSGTKYPSVIRISKSQVNYLCP